MMNGDSTTLHLISLNVRGIRDNTKRNKIFSWLRAQKTDIVCLQETYWTKELENKVALEWSGPCFFNNGSNHSKGVSILIKKNVPLEIENVFIRNDGRTIALRLVHKNCRYLLLNVYAPTKMSEKTVFFKHLLYWFNKIKTKEDLVISGGDWNTTQSSLDTRGASRVYKLPRYFKRFIQKNNLVDIWRKMYPMKKQFTWRQKFLGVYSRLDYWLVSAVLYSEIYSADIRPALKCDHNAISMKLKISSGRKGKGYWKLNNALLSDQYYINCIKNIIQKVKLELSKENPQIKWEVCKIKIKEFSLKYSKQKQKERECYLIKLQEEFNKQSEKVDENPIKREIDKLENIKNELDKLYTYKCKGAYIRAREKWMELGEKSTKYFLKKETINGVKKEIGCIIQNKKEYTERCDILKVISNYFGSLYAKSKSDVDVDIETYLKNTELKELNDNDALSCEGLLTENECYNAVCSMQNNKAPGSDGLSSEFYKCFWLDIKDLLIECLNEGYSNGELSESQKQGILTLLFKKGDRRKLDNWRPISLLNIDYKILARVLSQRLQKVIHLIVSFDQTGYIRGRSASDNIRLVQDVIDYCTILEKQGLILFLDFKQAFDCVRHDFLFETLKRFNFKESFIRWVKAMYTNARGKVINNGWLSDSFKIDRGVRQGCPLSALLFVLVVEVMASRIRSNKNISGIAIPTCEEPPIHEVKISQLADDTALFVNSTQSGNAAVQDVIIFGKHSGLKLNFDKTHIMALNVNYDEENRIYNLECSNEPIKYLGIALCRNKKDFNELNWSVKIAKIKRIVTMWKMRYLTYYGKIVIIKMLLISQLIYLGTCYEMPERYNKELNKIIHTFLWNSKREKVKRAYIINQPQQGGLGMIDLDSRMKSLTLSLLPKILSTEKQPWKYFCLFWLNKLGGISPLLQYNCSPSDMYKLSRYNSLPTFYVKMLTSWAELHYLDMFQVTHFENEIIWNNSNIKYNNKVMYFKNWIEKGVFKINQLVENGRWKSFDQINDMLSMNSLCITFQYMKIKSAFPKYWFDKLSNNQVENAGNREMQDSRLTQIKTGDFIDITTSKAKQFYTYFVDLKKIIHPTVLFHWQETIDISEEYDWSKLFTFKFGKLFNNRVRQYNFKLFHRILPFKENLVRWKITIDMTCNHCKDIETIMHVLLHCPQVNLFWQKLSYFIGSQLNENIEIDEKVLLLGYDIENKDLTLLNVILIFAQFTIYRLYILCQFTSKQFNCVSLLAEFKRDLFVNLKFLEKSNKIQVKEEEYNEMKKL